MSVSEHAGEAPFASRRGFLLGLVALAAVLGVVVVVDVLPRVDPPPPTVEGKRFLPRNLGPIDGIEIVRGRKDFRLERVPDGWEMLDAEGRASIPAAHVRDFLATILDLVELVDIGSASDISLAEFGLQTPKEKIVLEPRNGPQIQILLGDRNPPLTGIYALILPGKRVVLVGAVLLLEMDKLAALASAQAP